MTPYLFNAADFGGEPISVKNARGNPLFKAVNLEWSEPRLWAKDASPPVVNDDDCSVYALVRNHGNAHTKNFIVYIGLTTSPKTRFYNHPQPERSSKSAAALVSV